MPEHQNIEWKQSWRDEYLKWICGFANANGGTIFIGKDDKGNIVGIEDTKRLMDDIPNKIQNHLGIICDVNLHKISGKQFIEIKVNSSDFPISYQGKYHYRSGSTKQELKGSALNEFLLKKIGKTWDSVIDPDTTIEDIDKQAIEEFKNKATKSQRLPAVSNETSLIDIFENLQLSHNQKLNRAAILLFGINPCKYFINAYAR